MILTASARRQLLVSRHASTSAIGHTHSATLFTYAGHNAIASSSRLVNITAPPTQQSQSTSSGKTRRHFSSCLVSPAATALSSRTGRTSFDKRPARMPLRWEAGNETRPQRADDPAPEKPEKAKQRSWEGGFIRDKKRTRRAIIPNDALHAHDIGRRAPTDLYRYEKRALKRERITALKARKKIVKVAKESTKPVVDLDSLPLGRVLNAPLTAEQKETVKEWQALSIHTELGHRLACALPTMVAPTVCQQVTLQAMKHASDIHLKAFASTGKSLGVLIGLLNQHPSLLSDLQRGLLGQDKFRDEDEEGKEEDKRHELTSILVVPSQELVEQYIDWVRQIVPKQMHGVLSDVISTITHKPDSLGPERYEDQIDILLNSPPRILVTTPGPLVSLMERPRAEAALNIPKLRTLALDEADALFKLPYTFPKERLSWKMEKHLPSTVQAMNRLMRRRCTFSSGKPILNAGIEIRKDEGDDRNGVSPSARRTARRAVFVRHEGEKEGNLKQDKGDSKIVFGSAPGVLDNPLQLIVLGATAGAVMRNFLGARTGWLRTGTRGSNGQEVGKWIDLTGSSPLVNKADEMEGIPSLPSGVKRATDLANGAEHYCVVVDEPVEATEEEEGKIDPADAAVIGPLVGQRWRNIDSRLHATDFRDANTPSPFPLKKNHRGAKGTSSRKAMPAMVHEAGKLHYSPSALSCIAFLFAAEAVKRGMLVFPSGVSHATLINDLTSLGVPVKVYMSPASSAVDASPTSNDDALSTDEEVLWLVNADSVRGLNPPGGVSHVFLLGGATLNDPSAYVHIAGRVNRLGSDATIGAVPGKVITLLNGAPSSPLIGRRDKDQTNRSTLPQRTYSADEMRLGMIYHRLSIRPKKLPLLSVDDYYKMNEIDQTLINADLEEQEGERAAAPADDGDDHSGLYFGQEVGGSASPSSDAGQYFVDDGTGALPEAKASNASVGRKGRRFDARRRAK